MQPTFSSSRILLPVQPWFIFASLFVALLFNFIPPAGWLWLPDWVALFLVFWNIREPRYVGMGSAFLLGIFMDVADASILGQHAIAYVLISYLSSSFSRRILWFGLSRQALHVVFLLLLAQFIQLAVRYVPGIEYPGLSYFIGPLIGMVIWPVLTFILLLPQYQPVDRDENRPI